MVPDGALEMHLISYCSLVIHVGNIIHRYINRLSKIRGLSQSDPFMEIMRFNSEVDLGLLAL